MWAAECLEGGTLALKEIICSSREDLLNAMYEGHLLNTISGEGMLAGGRAEEPCIDGPGVCRSGSRRLLPLRACAGRLPLLVDCETTQLGPDLWRVRLAMTRLLGDPLDLFLENRRLHFEQSKQDYEGSRAFSRQFLEACHFAREMLVQLAPTFEHIAGSAYHRDVNAHNILIHKGEQLTPHYSVVDFGLAVDTHCWQSEEVGGAVSSRPTRVGPDGASTWHLLDVGGDCRYWPVSAWLQFLLGWHALHEEQQLCTEYKMNLDTHAFGITALQILAELLPSPRDIDDGCLRLDGDVPLSCCDDPGADGGGGNHGLTSRIRTLLEVWDRYWGRVSPLHCCLVDTFTNKGDWDTLKVECYRSQVHCAIQDDLRAIRAALKDARDACYFSPMTAGYRFVAGLFDALLMLISSGDASGRERVEGPQLWQYVCKLLESDMREDLPAGGAASQTKLPCSSEACAPTPPPVAVLPCEQPWSMGKCLSEPLLWPVMPCGAAQPSAGTLAAVPASVHENSAEHLRAGEREIQEEAQTSATGADVPEEGTSLPQSGGDLCNPPPIAQAGSAFQAGARKGLPERPQRGSKESVPCASPRNGELIDRLSRLSDKVDRLAQVMAQLEEQREGRRGGPCYPVTSGS